MLSSIKALIAVPDVFLSDKIPLNCFYKLQSYKLSIYFDYFSSKVHPEGKFDVFIINTISKPCQQTRLSYTFFAYDTEMKRNIADCEILIITVLHVYSDMMISTENFLVEKIL
jgi:hypothetical protein